MCQRKEQHLAESNDENAANQESLLEQVSGWSSPKLLTVALLFLLSGASSLIYQVIWTRQMVFVFGSSTFASATVLSAFMGGLALGSFVAGKYVDRLKNPFLWYGILEAIIGLWALLAPVLFDMALPIYKAFWQQMHLQVLPFSLLRFAVVALILLIPTACMGATLPLLSRFVTTSISVVANRVGSLYAINTLGAVTGSLAGGFYLIPVHGLKVSTLLAAATNLCLGFVVLLLSKLWNAKQSSEHLAGKSNSEPFSDGASPESTENTENQSGEGKLSLPRPALYTMLAFGASGAIAMVYEVAWTRTFLMVIGSTTYAFTIMLSTFLVGIFLGSMLASRFADRVKEPVQWFSIMQMALGLSSVFAVVLFNYLPYINLIWNIDYIKNPQMGMYIRFLLAAMVILPTTLFLGATFPLAVKACTLELAKIGRSIGTLYSVNTLGAIIGSFAGGFLIIPVVGTEQALVICAAANALIGALLLLSCQNCQSLVKNSCIVSAVCLLVWAATSPKLWDLHFLTASQKLRRGMNFGPEKPTYMPFNQWAKTVKDSFEIEFWKDGMCANVAVVKFTDNQKSLFTNGHIDASDGVTDMATQVSLPTFPLLLKPRSKQVADVGWGSGCTMGYALLFPTVEKMICAEIEPAVIETSKYFHQVNMKPESDQRLQIELNDGRNFLLATDEKFDVITSEPSNPWQAGVCNLYTQEYFKICHDRLKDGGVFAMWWQCNEVSSKNLTHVFRALKNVFKHMVIFETWPGDFVACCSDEPIKIDLPEVNAVLEEPRLKAALAQWCGISVAEDFALKVSMAEDGIEKVIKDAVPNTDDRNFIEFDVARTYEQQNFTGENRKWIADNSGEIWNVIDWKDTKARDKAVRMATIAELAMVRSNESASRWAQESYKLYPNSYALCVQALIEAQKKGDFEKALQIVNLALDKFPNEARSLCVRGVVSLLGGAPNTARKDFEAALKSDPKNPTYLFRLSQTYMPELTDWYQLAIVPLKDEGSPSSPSNPQKTLAILSSLLSNEKLFLQNPPAIGTLGAAYLRLGKLDEAQKYLTEFLKIQRDDILGLKLLGEVFEKKGDKMGESYCKEKTLELSKVAALRLCKVAEGLASQKKDPFAVGALRKAINYYPASAEARLILRKLAMRSPEAMDFMQELSKFSFTDLQAYKEIMQKKGQ